MKLRFIALLSLLAILFSTSTTSAIAGRVIDASNILKGGPYYVLSENGVPNGMPCEWYAYATTVGLPYCAHPGIDISANYENLYAATDGVVEFAGPDAAYWPNHVDIRVTDGPYSGELHIYGHMSQVFVFQGQIVKMGDVLGVSGEAGGAPHVHFERRTAPSAQCPIGCAIDPEPVLHSDPVARTVSKPEKEQAKKTERKSDKPEDKPVKGDAGKDHNKKKEHEKSEKQDKSNNKSVNSEAGKYDSKKKVQTSSEKHEQSGKKSKKKG